MDRFQQFDLEPSLRLWSTTRLANSSRFPWTHGSSRAMRSLEREHVEYVPTQIVIEYVSKVFRDRSGAEVHGITYPSAVATGMSCVLFVESIAIGDWAHRHALSIEKWLELDKSRIKTQKVLRHDK